MARLNLVDPAAASGKSKELLDAVKSGMGAVPNMTRAMANSPAVLDSYLKFSSALGASSLPGRFAEQIALLTAQENGCGYCLSAHAMLGKKAGLDEAGVAAARRAEASDSKEAAGLRFARAVITAKGGVSDDEIRAARDAGYDDGQISEIVAHVAANTFTNFFNRTAQPDLDFPAVSL